MVLLFCLNLPKLDETVTGEYRDLPEPIQLPGCVPVHGKDLLDPVQDRSHDSYKGLLRNIKQFGSAEGIILNSRRFTWSDLSSKLVRLRVRSPNDKSANAAFFNARSQNDPLSFLPKGFLERTQGRGLVVPSWAPQIEVLSHRVTGEQKMNAVMLTEGLKVSLRPKSDESGLAGREEIAEVVKSLMEGEDGKKVRQRMHRLKDAAAKVLSEDGSSAKSLSDLAISSLSLNLPSNSSRTTTSPLPSSSLSPNNPPKRKKQSSKLSPKPSTTSSSRLLNYPMTPSVLLPKSSSKSLSLSLSSLKHTLASLSTTWLVSLILDPFGINAINVAKELGFSPFLFFPSAISSLFCLHFLKINKTVTGKYRDLPGPIQFLGCVLVHGRDLPDPYGLAEGIIMNTFVDMEEGAIKALLVDEPGKPPVYTIGPLIQTGLSDGSERFLLKGLSERTQGRGLVVPSWAPQIDVLSHCVTGEFLTLCMKFDSREHCPRCENLPENGGTQGYCCKGSTPVFVVSTPPCCCALGVAIEIWGQH
ncbi:hypothetical protein ACSBR2_016985 [Camellia fascicularis]